MRTLIDVPDQQLKELGVICAARKLSRAEAVRQAVAAYIEREPALARSGLRPLEGLHRRSICPVRQNALPEDGLA